MQSICPRNLELNTLIIYEQKRSMLTAVIIFPERGKISLRENRNWVDIPGKKKKKMAQGKLNKSTKTGSTTLI